MPKYNINKEKLFFCNSCSKSFTTKGALTRHNKEIHDIVQYECIFCHKTFKRKYRWKNHNCQKNMLSKENLFKFDNYKIIVLITFAEKILTKEN